MSRPFERNLARWFHEQAAEIDPQPGDRYAAEFPDEETADYVCQGILEENSEEVIDQNVEYEGVSQSLPTIIINGTPLHVVSVRRSAEEVSEHYEVSRWYATTIRNVLAQGDQTDSEAALLMVYEAGVGIETLETTQHLFAHDSILPLHEFQERIRNDLSPLDEHGRALVRAIDKELTFPQDPMENLDPLRTYCEIYDACARNEYDLIPDLIPHLGTYLSEEAFGEDWFEKSESEDNLVSQAEQLLKENQKHAARIQESQSVTKDTKSELEAYYSDTFINKVLETSDWTTITRSEAFNGELEKGSEGGGSGTGKSGIKQTRDPELESIEVLAEKTKVYGSGKEASGDRSIIATVPDGAFRTVIKFDHDISDEPYSFTDSSGDEVDAVEVDGEKFEISLSGLEIDAPHFYGLDVYVGHKTRRGTPENQFDFALVPEWFFEAIGKNTFGIDIDEETLTVRSNEGISLTPREADTNQERVVREVSERQQTITLDTPILLQPNSPPKVERLRCQVIEGPETPVPINIDFISEVEEASTAEVQFPLCFAALMRPGDWAGDELTIDQAIVANLDSGEFHSPNLGLIEIPNSDRRLLQIEQDIVEAGGIAPRETQEIKVGTGVPNKAIIDRVSADLIDAYTRLFNHFQDRDTVPSTDPWDNKTQTIVSEVLETYLNAVGSLNSGVMAPSFSPYRDLGTVRSESTDVVWVTPFHPLMLAYGLRVSEWRDQLVSEGDTAGFRFTRFRSLFSPVGLMPYRWSEKSNEIFSGHLLENNHLWASYGPIQGPASETPAYISDVVSDKLRAFSQAFPLLFTLHSERKLKINLINMGDLGAVIEGIFGFFKFINDHPEMNVPEVHLQIYGGGSEGGTLERFFASESADSSLRDKLIRRDTAGDIVDQLDKQITYIHAGESFEDETRLPAHLTLFRGVLEEQSGTMEMRTFPKALRMEGLLPHDEIDVDSRNGEIVSRSGAAFDLENEGIISRIGATVNSLEASIRDKEFTSDRSISKVITSGDQTNLPEIWSDSLWVLHVEPRVDLDFYVRSTSLASGVSEDTLMIHYSDQYDPGSPGFDVITTTNKRDPYLQALRQVLDETPGLDEISPETVLTRLVAIDGELALDLQQAGGNTRTELLGLVGGLAVSAEILAKELPEYEWIPISLNEFARHDRSYRGKEEGLLQYFGEGKASDDLCFIGVPRESATGDLTVKLWVVETKGGSSSISKGVDQVSGARENLSDLFYPDKSYADTGILRSEFGDVITQIANRLYHYDVISKERQEVIDQHSELLIDGDYTLELVNDAAGNIGEVIRIQHDIALPEQDVRDGVRILKLPTEVLKLINQPPTGENEIHPDLNNNVLAFDVEGLEESPGVQETVEPAEAEEVKPDIPSGDGDRKEATDSTSEEIDEDLKAKEAPGVDEDAKEGAEREEFEFESAEGEPSTPGGQTTESEPSEKEEPVTTVPTSGFSWNDEDFEALVQSLSVSPESELSIDSSRLTTALKEQFESLGVDVYEPNPADVSIGPRKIGVNVRPKSGQKVEKVLNSLDSISVHIQASGTITGIPNPAEGAIRLEIPHGSPRDIYIREGFENLEESIREPLNIPLGVNTENEHISIDLLDEHHMLVGGATGSGKSNFLATTICSLAASLSPDQVRLSLLDPKGIDFGRFEPLPHVDTYIDSSEEGVEYLMNLLETELKDRRDILRNRGTSSVQEYNQLANSMDFDPLPYRVIVIDEFADLVMSLSDSKDDFEDAVGRLAQIGRAHGYSILLATQRPDAQVVSGNIKTNFNCRVSFELPSNTDSRVILDQPGAEDLEGAGDMIALTSAGEEYHLQAYRLTPEDAVRIRDELT